MNFDGVSRTKEHAFFVRSIVWLVSLIYTSSCIPSVSAMSYWDEEYDCPIYCSRDCNIYIEGLKFDLCETSAYLNCECPLNPTLVIICIGIAVFVGGILCICGNCSHGGVAKSTVVAQPITANRVETAYPVTEPASVDPPRTTGSTTTAHQMSILIDSPLTTPQKPLSEEFHLPPAYNEAVRSAN